MLPSRYSRSDSRLDSYSDTELLNLVREEWPPAFPALYRRHHLAVFAYAVQCAGRDADAQVLVDRACEKVLRAIVGGAGGVLDRRYRDCLRLRLLAAVRNAAVRQTAREPEVSLHPEFVDWVNGGCQWSLNDGRALVAPFANLSGADQCLLWHTVVERDEPELVARIAGMEPDRLASRTEDALDALRQARAAAYSPLFNEECRGTARFLEAAARPDGAAALHGIQPHLDSCPDCLSVYTDLAELTSRLRLTLPPLLLGWWPGDAYQAAKTFTTSAEDELRYLEPVWFGSEAESPLHEPAYEPADDFALVPPLLEYPPPPPPPAAFLTPYEVPGPHTAPGPEAVPGISSDIHPEAVPDFAPGPEAVPDFAPEFASCPEAVPDFPPEFASCPEAAPDFAPEFASCPEAAPDFAPEFASGPEAPPEPGVAPEPGTAPCPDPYPDSYPEFETPPVPTAAPTVGHTTQREVLPAVWHAPPMPRGHRGSDERRARTKRVALGAVGLVSVLVVLVVLVLDESDEPDLPPVSADTFAVQAYTEPGDGDHRRARVLGPSSWLRYDSVNFTDGAADRLRAVISSPVERDALLEVRLDSLDARPLAVLAAPVDGSPGEVSVPIPATKGVHEVFLTASCPAPATRCTEVLWFSPGRSAAP